MEIKKNLKQFSTVCLLFRKLIKDSKDSIMICDGPGVFQKCLIQIIKRNMALFMLIIMKISMIRVHLKSEKYIIENANKINGVIVLTEAQRLDILNQFDVKIFFTIKFC